jgi:hypothetical protein
MASHRHQRSCLHRITLGVLLLTLLLPTALTAAVFTVTTTADDGPGSLREAITLANTTPGADTIAFDIPGDGPHMIQPLTPLPTITDPVTIDGYTQDGASPNTQAGWQATDAVLKIVLDGSLLEQIEGFPPICGLHVTCGNSTIRGLVIANFASVGILIEQNGNNVIEGIWQLIATLSDGSRHCAWIQLK